MTIYGLKNNIRKKVLLWIATASLILGNALFFLFNNILLNIQFQFPMIKEFIEKWEYLGVFSSQITVASTFGFITWLFNNYLWKKKIFFKILGIPNLNGQWEGVLESTYLVDGQPCKIDMTLTIKQTWETMLCISKFPKSTSFGDIICLDTESAEGTVLKFTFTNKSQDIKCELPQYPGYNELQLLDENTLNGRYFTQRIPSTRGTILLIRRDPSADINNTVTRSAAV